MGFWDQIHISNAQSECPTCCNISPAPTSYLLQKKKLKSIKTNIFPKAPKFRWFYSFNSITKPKTDQGNKRNFVLSMKRLSRRELGISPEKHQVCILTFTITPKQERRWKELVLAKSLDKTTLIKVINLNLENLRFRNWKGRAQMSKHYLGTEMRLQWSKTWLKWVGSWVLFPTPNCPPELSSVISVYPAL